MKFAVTGGVRRANREARMVQESVWGTRIESPEAVSRAAKKKRNKVENPMRRGLHSSSPWSSPVLRSGDFSVALAEKVTERLSRVGNARNGKPRPTRLVTVKEAAAYLLSSLSALKMAHPAI